MPKPRFMIDIIWLAVRASMTLVASRGKPGIWNKSR
jgi:hypothetical protein